MSREQVSFPDLLLSLDSSDLKEAEQVRTVVNQQLATDRGGTVLSSLVEHYLDSASSQVVLLLSSIREPHHKVLLEKLNEALNRPGSRVAAVTLLGHLVRKQPPWVHHISQSPLLPSLLRCLKTDADVVVLITGVLVLITLLPMIPQAGKQHIYDFFDVFGRLVSWSYRNPGHVTAAYLVHLRAAVYSLLHRLYGMFPCNFLSYLRLHYSMKENMDAFQEVVKPMLEHVRIHPQLVTGTQDYELEPSRWRCYEVHDIIIECSRLSLDPLESSCEDDVYCSPPSSPRLPCPLPGSAPQDFEAISSSGTSVSHPSQLTLQTSYIQMRHGSYLQDDVTWSPSSHCGLSTPPPEPVTTGSAPSPSKTSISGVTRSSPASVPVATPPEDSDQTRSGLTAKEHLEDGASVSTQELSLEDVIQCDLSSTELRTPPPSSRLLPLTSTPCPDEPPSDTSTPLWPRPQTSHDRGPTPQYESLFELALPRAASLFVSRKTQEALETAAAQQDEPSTVSPLKALDQMIVHGNDAHGCLSGRWSAGTRFMDQLGDKQQSMSSKGPAQGEEPLVLRSQLLLVHSQLQYERFKRQQHAIRNRRLLRRVINTAALEEQTVAMKAQLGVQDEEIRSLRSSLSEEQRRVTELKQDAQNQTRSLLDQNQRLMEENQNQRQQNQQLQSELVDSQARLGNLEAELRRVNNKANHADHLLTQLSLKLSSSEQLQQQIFLINQQLVLLRETNRSLREQLEEGAPPSWSEAAMLQRSVGSDVRRLKDGNVLLKQKLEAANQRIADLELQLCRKEQLILDQKELLEDTKNHSRAELLASESRCIALRRVSQTLQREMLYLYSQIHLNPPTGSDTGTRGSAVDGSSRDGSKPRPFYSSAVGILNGAVEALSSSPLSVSPIDSLAVGSFLDQQARRLFGPSSRAPEEEPRTEAPPLGQEVEEATPLAASPQAEPPAGQRRDRLSIMDYDQTLAEF